MYILGAAVWRGIKATNLLLDGAKRLPRVKNVDKLYMKRGDYTNAKKDFFSVDPTDVQKLQVRILIPYFSILTVCLSVSIQYSKKNYYIDH